jgi:hypothetical protein
MAVADAHAYSLLGSYIYGFALTKIKLPFQDSEQVAQVAQQMQTPFPAGEYPNLAAFITDHAMRVGYDYGDEFAIGLEVIPDGLEALRVS